MTSDARREMVLVVDDSPETLGFLTEALENAGLTVLVANSGAAALRAVQQITPDLVLMDAVMPEMNGFETCRALKADAAQASIPVVFMTGLSETEHVVEGLNAGGVDYVTKPIVLEELLARIRVHLANARLAQSARRALDVTGRFLLATDSVGRLIWCTPQASSLLASAFDGDEQTLALPQALSEKFRALIAKAGGASSAIVTAGTRRFEFSYLSPMGPEEFLFRLSELGGDEGKDFLKQHFALTTREAEVLIWIARGKPNRDISEILGISPRTVNKHLEQIFTKLGVENRASAAAHATRALTMRG